MTAVINLAMAPRPKKGGKGKGAYFKANKTQDSYAIWLAKARVELQKVSRRRRWKQCPRGTVVEVCLDLYFARPKDRPDYCPKEIWATGQPFRRPVIPDADNASGSVLDALNGGKGTQGQPRIWMDDCQVDFGHVYRWVCGTNQRPHIRIVLQAQDLLGRPL